MMRLRCWFQKRRISHHPYYFLATVIYLAKTLPGFLVALVQRSKSSPSMGAACVRSSDDEALESTRRKMVRGDVTLPSFITLASNSNAAESKIEASLKSAIHAFDANLATIGQRADVHLARYARSLPKKPLYLQEAHANGAPPTVIPPRSSMLFLQVLSQKSVRSFGQRIHSPASCSELLSRYKK